MKLTINRDELIRALKLAKLAMPSRPAIPVLSCALLECSADQLTIRTANLDQWISISIAAEVDSPGRVALSADRLIAIADKSSADVLGITVDDKFAARIAGKSLKATVFGLNAAEFPEQIVAGDVAVALSCASTDLLNSIARVSPVVATVPNGRDQLMGIHARSCDGKLRLEAADGRRLHVMQTEVACPGDLDEIIPNSAIRAIREVLGCGGSTGIEFRESTITVECGTSRVTSKLVDLAFPNVDPMLGFESEPAFVAPREELIDAVGRVAMLSEPETNRVTVVASKDGIALSAKRKDAGECEATIDAPQATSVTFSGSHIFIADALRAMSCEEAAVEIALNAHDKQGNQATPLIFRDGGFTAIVMPQAA